MKNNILIDPLDLAQVIVYIMTIMFENTIHTIQVVKNVCISLYGSPHVDFRGNVYILNFSNDKKYCGQTINYEIRMRAYNARKQHTALLQRAMDKHTFGSLIIDRLEIPLCMMDTLEIFFIHYYKLTNPKYGYNGNSGGHRRYTRSADTKQRHSASMMGNKNALGFKRSAETIAKYMAGEKNAMYGRKGKLAPGSKRIIAFGNIYETAKEAGDELAIKLSLRPRCITGWIKLYTNEVFYITNEFYDCAVANEVKHITKDFYEYIIDNEIAYFTNELYTIWSAFERFWDQFVEMRKPKQTNRHHAAKRIIAFGNIYETAQDAGDEFAIKLSLDSQCVYGWIRDKRYTDEVFYITDEFYDCAIENEVKHITKDFYEYIIDNDITYFTNETYTIWSVFERFCVPFIEMRKPRQTNRHHGAKPVVAFGKAYTSGQIAADTLRETYKQKSKQFITEWISHGRYPNDIFKITPEFYDYVIANNITDISKSFYQQWTYM